MVIFMDYSALYNEWLQKATDDPDLTKELQAIAGQEDEILDRFYRALEFGTAGLRGVIGAGTNRMNIYTVGRATQGLADYINANYKNPSVAIGYDSRIKSEYFSKEAASILAANGIQVYLYTELEPTPCLSYAVRALGACGGIILTASHNPAKYNGYKCYNPNGYQMTDEEAAQTYTYIEKVDYFTGIRKMDFDTAVASGSIRYIGEEMIEAFLAEVEKQCVNKGVCKEADLKVIYTPLNGTGNKPVREILRRIGVKNIYVVPEQEQPDGNFPTCPFPNPEIKEAFALALKMNETVQADLMLATDPDCDRVGIAVMQNGQVRLMSGNEVGAMLLNYLLMMKQAQGTLSANSIAVKSFVSTDLAEVIAKKYGCTFKNLLTGFKYIGELITELEAQGRAEDFVMGFEESYGYLAGTHARDKDAVVASMLICEMAAYYKTKGMSLGDVMDSLYKEYGYYLNTVESYAFEGAEGMEKMAGIMNALRACPPTELAGSRIVCIRDYQESICKHLDSNTTDPIELPKSNVLEYKTADGNKLIIRPSGTEPKIKAYITSIAKDRAQAEAVAEQLRQNADQIMYSPAAV